MSTLIPAREEPVTLQDKSPKDTPLAIKSDNPSFVLHGIDNVVYEEVRPIHSSPCQPICPSSLSWHLSPLHTRTEAQEVS
jgi:hypothetical protein